MSKKRTNRPKQRSNVSQRPSHSARKPNPNAASSNPRGNRQDGLRETVESIVIAFVLAFLFRAFEAEAFVIPTGSMAPTLLGRHKDVDCERCGYHFTIGASDELDPAGNYLPMRRIRTALCPNCRYENSVHDLPVFKGDRILVNKFPYEFSNPSRFDVAVFKYPEEPKTNYIKRIVGLPGEKLIIRRGDLYRVEDGKEQILRKDDPNKQRDLLQVVYDNDHPEHTLHEMGWPKRWAAMEHSQSNAFETIAGWSETSTGWKEVDERHAFELRGSKLSELQWLRYRHIVPTPQVWDEAMAGNISIQPRPELITDFCSYNAYTGGYGRLHGDVFWVGDLSVSCDLTINTLGDDARFVTELQEGPRAYQCQFDLATGQATLAVKPGLDREQADMDVLATATTSLSGPGDYRIRFVNVDHRLSVWVNGTLVAFDKPTEYTSSHNDLPGPQDADLVPVGLAAEGVDAEVSHLLVERDIYYRSDHTVFDADYEQYLGDEAECRDEQRLRSLLTEPNRWAEYYSRFSTEARFELGENEYMVLGDNSPRSKDSRLWHNSRDARHPHAVPSSALVGKAFFIYWPHGKPFLNDGQGFAVQDHTPATPTDEAPYPSFRIPFYPQFMRMHRIR